MRFERCCECDETTGRAGRGDDSIYVEVDGKEIGPLCLDCFYKYEPEDHFVDANKKVEAE